MKASHATLWIVCGLVFVAGCGKEPANNESSVLSSDPPRVVTPAEDYHPPAIANTIHGEIDEKRATTMARDYLEDWGKDLSQFNLHESPSLEKVEQGDYIQWVVRWDVVREPKIHAGVEVVVSPSGIGASYVD